MLLLFNKSEVTFLTDIFDYVLSYISIVHIVERDASVCTCWSHVCSKIQQVSLVFIYVLSIFPFLIDKLTSIIGELLCDIIFKFQFLLILCQFVRNECDLI